MSRKVDKMADYKKMYFLLFNKITDTITELQDIQQKAEEMCITHEGKIIELNDFSLNKDDN